jgi:hypothetical protein
MGASEWQGASTAGSARHRPLRNTENHDQTDMLQARFELSSETVRIIPTADIALVSQQQ